MIRVYLLQASSGLARVRRPRFRALRCKEIANALGAEETFGDVPPSLRELRRAECHVDVLGIVKQHVVISKRIPVRSGTPLTAASCGSLERMRLENPVADVDHVNVLLDDDVARKRAIVHPVAQTPLGG